MNIHTRGIPLIVQSRRDLCEILIEWWWGGGLTNWKRKNTAEMRWAELTWFDRIMVFI